MRKRITFGLIAVVAVAALAFGGCGGGDDETASLTKEQFTKRANALCQKRGEERVAEYRARQAAQANQNDDRPDDLAREDVFREAFVIPFQEMVGELEDLGVPKGDEKELEAIFREWRKGGEVFEKDPLLLLQEPPVFDKANKLSTKYGLTGCIF